MSCTDCRLVSRALRPTRDYKYGRDYHLGVIHIQKIDEKLITADFFVEVLMVYCGTTSTRSRNIRVTSRSSWTAAKTTQKMHVHIYISVGIETLRPVRLGILLLFLFLRVRGVRKFWKINSGELQLLASKWRKNHDPRPTKILWKYFEIHKEAFIWKGKFWKINLGGVAGLSLQNDIFFTIKKNQKKILIFLLGYEGFEKIEKIFWKNFQVLPVGSHIIFYVRKRKNIFYFSCHSTKGTKNLFKVFQVLTLKLHKNRDPGRS